MISSPSACKRVMSTAFDAVWRRSHELKVTPAARCGGGSARKGGRGDRAEGLVPLGLGAFVPAPVRRCVVRGAATLDGMDHSHPAPEGSRAGPLPEPPESVAFSRAGERSGPTDQSPGRPGLHVADRSRPLSRRSREFRLLFIGQGVSFFGSMVTYVALPYQAYRISHSSLIVGLLSLTELIPLLITAFVGGALADSVDRRRMVRLTESGHVSRCRRARW